jgi:hypothetical protein
MYIYGIFMDGLKETGKVYHCAGNVLDLMYGYDDELLLLEQEIIPLVVPVIKEKYEDKGRAKFLLMQGQQGQQQDGKTQGQQDGQTQGKTQGQQDDDHLFVMEMTPVGNVIMQYDGKKESFVYYSDNIVPFRFLETVSRKYMTTFNKTFLCASNNQPLADKQPSQKQPMTTKELMNQTKNPVLKRKELIEVVMNRYSNAGRFSNFKMLQPVAKHITDKKRLLSFRDFKGASIKK